MTEARKLPPPLPPRLDWFVQTQLDELTCGGIPEWFHGAISREDAENLLESQPLGSFLIRISHSHVGYTLSYKAQNCCRHFMVKLSDDGSFTIPGEERAHACLDALVIFHQQQPLRPHGDLLTQPCRQDPANADYADLFLCSNALAEEATSSAPGLSKHQNPSSCPVAPLEEFQASAKPVLLHRTKERKPLAEPDRASTEEPTSSCPPKAPLEEARQKLWRNLKMIPQTGKKVQQQMKSHLAAASSSSLWYAKPSVVTHSSGAKADDSIWENNVYTDPSVATSLASPSQPQAPRNRDDPSQRVSRSVSWSEATTRVKDWHQAVVRALSSQVSKPEPRDLKEPQDCLPEEYRHPPPFAPGYC
ncbi:hematopoietic SH2 domain-containing protein isoform X2 [Hippopotamus amphibius kiboko]|uniref:hematopoietic SH2 domain-containing protein isoform X2 n=1 Tax=Hippopotamus amphibius kiboko TaxID=575201 RepID=UPI0025966EBE|nr:hematopoietic SH2 domain-containing protein isoform X2 [Hippopotamus amphibius kiboko]